MILKIDLPERTKPLKLCPGCGDPVISYYSYRMGQGRSGEDEVGYKCALCRKTSCSSCSWDFTWFTGDACDDGPLNMKYALFGAQVKRQSPTGHVCVRCVGEFEMKLINDLGYTDLPLYLHVKWHTQAAKQYFNGILQGRYL